MFPSCSRDEGLSVAESVSNSRRSKLNHVVLSTALVGSPMKANNLFSMPFEGMWRFTPFGSFVSMNAPRFALELVGTPGAGATGAGAVSVRAVGWEVVTVTGSCLRNNRYANSPSAPIPRRSGSSQLQGERLASLAYVGAVAMGRSVSSANRRAAVAAPLSPRALTIPAGAFCKYELGLPSKFDKLEAFKPVLPSRRPMSPSTTGAQRLANEGTDERLMPVFVAIQSS